MARTVDYFCFGSNLDPYVLNVERGIKPYSTQCCYAKDYRLTFNIKGSFLEPSFANIIPAEDNKVWGVCHTLRKQDFKHLQKTEGAKYDLHDVDVVFEDGSIRTVRTLADYANDNLSQPPSKRYMNLMLTGAKHYHLPQEHIDQLQRIKPFHIPVVSNLFTLGLKIFKPVKFRLST